MFNKKLKEENAILRRELFLIQDKFCEMRKERNALQDALNMSDDDKVEAVR